MKLTTYFNILLNQTTKLDSKKTRNLKYSLTFEIDNFLQRVIKIHNNNLVRVGDEWIKRPIDEHLKIRAVKKSFSEYLQIKREDKKEDKQNALSSFLESRFKLKYKPIVPKYFDFEDGYLMFWDKNTGSERVSNIFMPVSKVNSYYDGKPRTHIKFKFLNAKLEERTVIESTRDLSKSDRLNTIWGDNGIFVDAQKANIITKYVSNFLMQNELDIKHEKGTLQTGWDKDNEFLLPTINNDIVWLHTDFEEVYVKKGNLKAQEKLIKLVAKDKLFINILGALSSNLYGLGNIDAENFSIHLGGITGKGKSKAIKIAMSLYGDHTNPVFGRSWNATAVGLETYWASRKCMPTWIDEMELQPDYGMIVSTIYQFHQAKGKARGKTKDGDVDERIPKTFKGVCFTSGEKSIVEIQNSVSGRTKPRGITRRVIDIDIGDYYTELDESAVLEITDNNYGFFGVEYIKYLQKNQKEVELKYFEFAKKYKKMVDTGKDTAFAMLHTSLYVLGRMGVIDSEDIERQIQNIEYYARAEEEKYKTSTDIMGDFRAKFVDFVISNSFKFNKKRSREIITNSGVYNKDKQTTETLHEFKENRTYELMGLIDYDKGVVAMLPTQFAVWCSNNGFVKDQVLEELKKNNCMKISNGRKYDYQMKIDPHEKNVKLYAFQNLDADFFSGGIPVIIESEEKEEEITPVPKEKVIEGDLFTHT